MANLPFGGSTDLLKIALGPIPVGAGAPAPVALAPTALARTVTPGTGLAGIANIISTTPPAQQGAVWYKPNADGSISTVPAGTPGAYPTEFEARAFAGLVGAKPQLAQPSGTTTLAPADPNAPPPGAVTTGGWRIPAATTEQGPGGISQDNTVIWNQEANEIANREAGVARSQLASAGLPASAVTDFINGLTSEIRTAYFKWRAGGYSAGESATIVANTRDQRVAEFAKKNGVNAGQTLGGAAAAIGGANTVTNKDVNDAVNTYRATTEGALAAYKNPGAVTAPQPVTIATPIVGQRVDSIDQRYQPAVTAGKTTATTAFGAGALTPTDVTAAQVSPAERLQAAAQRATQVAGTALGPAATQAGVKVAATGVGPAAIQQGTTVAGTALGPAAVQQGVQVAGTTLGPAAVQRGTTVAGTGLDTTQSDQARAAIGQNLEELQATARGQGAGMLAALARTKLGLAKAAQAGEGLARSARGSERRGALLNAQGLATEAGANALTASEAQAAQERQAASQAVGQQLQATRATDVDVAAKKADLERSQKELQAQLDAARAAGDAGRVQEITTKQADLQRQRNELQATLDTTVNTQNTNRQQEVNLKRADLDQQKNALQAQLDSARLAGDAGRQQEITTKLADLQRAQNEQQASLDQQTATQNAARQQEINVKRADLDQQRNALQAQLDSARAANDQSAILSVQAKQADLDTQIKALNQSATNTVAISNALERNKAAEAGANRTTDLSKFNAGQINTTAEANRAAELDAAKFTSGQRATIDQSNLDRGLTAETGNANRAQDAQKTTVDQGLAAQAQQESQRVANERLKIDLQTAAQQAAQGLLNEAQREELIRQARAQQDLAERRFQQAVTADERAAANEDRKFWANIVSGVVTTAGGLVGGPVGAAIANGASAAVGAKAARGGLVEGPRTLVGEGEHRELVIPIKGKLSRALEEALAIDAEPFAKPVPINGLMEALKRSLAAKEEPAKPRRSGHTEMIAASNVRARKAAH